MPRFEYAPPVAHLFCNRQMLPVVLHGLAEVPLRLIQAPEVLVRPALPSPVAHLLCNRQVLRVVLDGLRIVPKRLIRAPKVPVRPTFARPVANPFEIARSCRWYSMAFA